MNADWGLAAKRDVAETCGLDHGEARGEVRRAKGDRIGIEDA